MPLTFTLDPSVDPALRDGLLGLWADVTNAGGAVGFVPPVARDAIRPELVKHLAAMSEGRMRLLVGRDAGGRRRFHRSHDRHNRANTRAGAKEQTLVGEDEGDENPAAPLRYAAA